MFTRLLRWDTSAKPANDAVACKANGTLFKYPIINPGVDDEKKKDAPNPTPSPSHHNYKGTNGVSKQSEWEKSPKEAAKPESKNIAAKTPAVRAKVTETIKGRGEITRLNDDAPKGVIDGTYLFSKAEFCKPGCQFDEGSIVDFEAEKCLGDSSYTVVSMKIHIKEIDDPHEDTLVRCRKYDVKITEISEEDITVQWGKVHELHKIAKNHLPVYTMKCGDWLRVEVKKPKDESESSEDEMLKKKIQFNEVNPEHIVRIEPTKQKTIVGKLIKRRNYCIIDNNIFCANDEIDVGAHLHSGCTVKATAVESEQIVQLAKGVKNFQWRAVDVAMSTFATYMKVDAVEADPEAKKREEDMGLLLEEKRGIRVSPKDVIFPSVKVGHSVEKEVEVSNMSDCSVILKDIRLVGDQNVCQFAPVISRRESEDIVTVLGSQERFVFKIMCHPTGKGLGRTKELYIVDFGAFKVGGYVKVNVLSDNMEELDTIKKPTVDFKKKSWKKKKSSEIAHEMVVDANRQRIRGIQPVRTPFFMPRRIPIYHIPKVLWKVFQTEDETLMAKEYPKAMNPLCFDNYIDKFSVCLWFEEMENDRKRRETDLKDIQLKQEGEFFVVNVPGLKDFQPPLLTGDPLDVLNASDPNAEKYEGFIHKVSDTTIHIKFPEAFFLTYKGEPLNVQFRLGRMTFKRNHFAIHTAVTYLKKEFLFPKEPVKIKEPRIHFVEVDSNSEDEEEKNGGGNSDDEEYGTSEESTPIKLFNKPANKFQTTNTTKSNIGNVDPLNRRAYSIRQPFISDSGHSSTSKLSPAKLKWVNKNLNEEQKECVRRILHGRARPTPYIIFGPPGTGKTITLVESVVQISLLDSSARLLVCAPSNAAADVIALELLKSNKYKPGDFVRFNGYMRTDSQIPEPLKPYSVDGEFLDSVMKHKMIICTCVTAGQFFCLNLDAGHFTHVFVDEAGYCTEPETMIPTVLLALDKGGQLILAGDPFQLGPVLMSDAANNCGMQVSFLQRLMEKQPLYQRNIEKFPETKYNPFAVTKLVKNYRTNETLLKIPSQLFYDDELIACASHEDAYALCQDPKIAKEIFHSSGLGVPIVFHGIQGSSSRDLDSPSWYNTAEIVEVNKYIRALKRCGLKNADIGIITPYRKQVDKIRQTCIMEQNKLNENDIPKIGSVEEFQGGERKVIIISTVRSMFEERIEQQVGRLTFIYSHKRFNVALTRAKALLIVIGNPHILCHNKNWRKLITYCKELGTYKGCNLPLQLEPQYLKELEMEEQINNVAPVINPPDKPNKDYNPDGIDSEDEDEDDEEYD